MARLLVIQHEDDCPPAWFGDWLEAAGLQLDVRAPYRGSLGPVPLADSVVADDIAGVLVMGGEMGAYDDARCPWLRATRVLLRSTVSAGIPTLGICLGHQLLSVALGGEVIVNPKGRSLGITTVQRTDTGRQDALFAGVPDDAVAVQWNNDVVSRLPDDAEVLARDPRGDIQAARFGERAWGVQFHPEVHTAIFEEWVAADPEGKGSPSDGGPVPVQVVTDIKAAERRLAATWQPFAERFAAVVFGTPTSRQVASSLR
jgi:GMP synthase (glutamine-hydrolysing)